MPYTWNPPAVSLPNPWAAKHPALKVLTGGIKEDPKNFKGGGRRGAQLDPACKKNLPAPHVPRAKAPIQGYPDRKGCYPLKSDKSSTTKFAGLSICLTG
ncbi:hypothetical protein DSO57_1030930 [Entomophthora muscae]|uniref:Uncharacterized protein n=1 Tax=Entomophthora muscae TaxID=34485 RepID=A0ACC2SDH7_9FUNG|nr:hypothetical protein DSO57_1030930 [Entomophthora muscae]